MNENEFEHEGKVYTTIKAPSNIDPCEGCAFDLDKKSELCGKSPTSCYDVKNRCELIFVEKQPCSQ